MIVGLRTDVEGEYKGENFQKRATVWELTRDSAGVYVHRFLLMSYGQIGLLFFLRASVSMSVSECSFLASRTIEFNAVVVVVVRQYSYPDSNFALICVEAVTRDEKSTCTNKYNALMHTLAGI